MKLTCLVNCYNYAAFVVDAVESALRQTVPFDEIIVVDDGSTDGSRELLASRYGNHRKVQIIAKSNQGQLSCFNVGFARSTGDLVFFLDADDIYEPNYVEQSLRIYNRDAGVDFLFCGHRQFGQRDALQLKFPEDRDLGYSVVVTSCLREWIGGPTSCLSMRRSVLEQILPLPFEPSWRTRADDCLVFGSSLAGARKYFLAEPLVGYRVHGRNHFFGRGKDASVVYQRRLAINALFKHLEDKFCYNDARFGDFHHREFCTIAKPTFRQLKHYFAINARLPMSFRRRLNGFATITAHYLLTKMRRKTAGSLAENRTTHPSAQPEMIPFPRGNSRELAANSYAPRAL